jgi:hypothetical protein
MLEHMQRLLIALPAPTILLLLDFQQGTLLSQKQLQPLPLLTHHSHTLVRSRLRLLLALAEERPPLHRVELELMKVRILQSSTAQKVLTTLQPLDSQQGISLLEK